jgi:hypothetical protein
MPDLDTGFVVQVDVEDDAASLIERAMILESLSRSEKHAFEAMPSQEALQAFQQAWVVIDHQHNLWIGQGRVLFVFCTFLTRAGPPTANAVARRLWLAA